jgi:hypothetical protein
MALGNLKDPQDARLHTGLARALSCHEIIILIRIMQYNDPPRATDAAGEQAVFVEPGLADDNEEESDRAAPR